MSVRRAARCLATTLVLVAACRPVARDTSRAAKPASTAVTRESADKLLLGALGVLDRLDDFDEARAMELVFERISQWSRAARPPADAWRVDPLVDALPPDLRGGDVAPPLDAESLTLPDDVVWLRDERWLADIAKVARGDAVTDLDVAANLFRWTVRSLAPVADPPMVATVDSDATRWWLPGEILLAGRASPAQRAWVFLELVRHAGLDGALLATPDAAGNPRPWIPAVVCDGEAYLFEPTYGMAIPIIAGWCGLVTSGGSEGVGWATTKSVVSTSFAVILLNLVISSGAYLITGAAG